MTDTSTCDLDHDGHASTTCGGDDCDDADALRHPGATETCDAGNRDEDCDPSTFGTRDADGDAHVDVACCNDDAGQLRCGDDCDDRQNAIHPTAGEICNLMDDDCDASIDEAVRLTCFTDNDMDRYAPVGATSSMWCACPTGTTSMAPEGMTTTDCNDSLVDVSPGSPEICGNGRDDDCDTMTDETGTRWYADCDGDGYGDMAATPVVQCSSPGRPPGCTATGAGYVQNATDCNDVQISIHPMQPDLCDGRNEDCDASTADGAGDTRVAVACDDADDADVCTSNGRTVCSGAAVSCMETAPNIVEICGGGDEDCDGTTDETTAANADCNARGLPNASSVVCSAGACVVGMCGAGHEDCNAGAGCESTCAWHGCTAGGCDDVVAVSTQDSTSYNQVGCAVRRSGIVDCWGHIGTMGMGPSTSRPQPVPGLSNIVDAEGPYFLSRTGAVLQIGGASPVGHSWIGGPVVELGVNPYRSTACFVRMDGVVACRESGEMGNLGNGSTAFPTDGHGFVSGLSDAVEVGVGQLFACARRRGGTVVCWGANYAGQLGDGVATHGTCTAPTTGDCALTFVTVAGITNAVEISVNFDSACARLATGEVRCWGRGGGASRGSTMCPGYDGTGIDPCCGHRHRPGLPRPSVSSWCRRRRVASAVRASDDNPYYINNDDTLGLALRDQPVTRIPGQPALRALGTTVLCEGSNTVGQIGDGTMIDRPMFVPVVSPP